MNLTYSLKHWLSTLVLGPLLSWLFEIVTGQENGVMAELIAYYPLILFLSLAYSFPLLLLHFTVLYLLDKFKAGMLLTKIVLIALTIAGIFLTLAYLSGISGNAWSYSYTAAAVVTGLLIRLKGGRNAPEEIKFERE